LKGSVSARIAAVAVTICTLFAIGAWALKTQCSIETSGRGVQDVWSGKPGEWICYNDIQPLYVTRDIDDNTFPYITAYLLGGRLKGGGVEYPVLTGMFMWASGLLVDDPDQYLDVSALLLAPFALLTAWLLARMAGWRALLWAASPSIVMYAFHNWDLLVIAAATVGFFMWRTGRYSGAAIAFGIGGALKLYPLLFLAPLFLDRWMTGDRKKAWRTGWWGLGTVIGINLPFMYWNPPSWWLTYRFHSLRYPNVDSLWGQTFPDLDPSILNLVTAALTALTLAATLWWGIKRSQRDGAFPFLPIAGAVLCGFLLWSKVQSPQYMLWILPFFALLRVRAGWWIAAMVIDVAAYVGVFRHFYDLRVGGSLGLDYFLMVSTSFLRAALWAAIVVVFARAESAVLPTSETRKVSQPLPRLSPSEA
jgi:uncharacterized membrane protein